MITHRDSTLATVTREALARRAAAKVGLPEETAEKLVGAFLDSVEESLLQGERIDLGGLLDLGVVVEPARIRRDQAGRFAEIAPARSRLDVQVGGTLRDRLASQRTAAILLAMPKEGFFGEILAEHFARLGWQVRRVDGAEAIRTELEGPRPYLLVCDHSFPDRDELVLRLKTQWRTNTIPVVTMHRRNEDLDHPSRLLVKSDLSAVEPIAVHPFLRQVDQVLARASEESVFFERQLAMRFPAREEEILRAFDVSDSFFKDSGFRGDPLVGLTTAFREAVRNAEIHGSREDAARSIDVELLLDREKLTASIEDEGPGFDHASYRQTLGASAPISVARKRHKTGGVGGLGIYLMERCADKVEYSERGNRVTITKMRAAPAEAPRAV